MLNQHGISLFSTALSADSCRRAFLFFNQFVREGEVFMPFYLFSFPCLPGEGTWDTLVFPCIILTWMPQLSVSWGKWEFIRSGKNMHVNVRLLLVEISASPLRSCLILSLICLFLKMGLVSSAVLEPNLLCFRQTQCLASPKEKWMLAMRQDP